MAPVRSHETVVWTLPNSQAEKEAKAAKAPKQTRKKGPSHIPRPPNAFILFRSSFIRNQAISLDVETNHSTLSQIIGMTWKGLSAGDRSFWQDRAKVALEEHRRLYPKYAFRPTQTSPAAKAALAAAEAAIAEGEDVDLAIAAATAALPTKRKRAVEPKDKARSKKIAELLVEGIQGPELETIMREFDRTHAKKFMTRFDTPVTQDAYEHKPSTRKSAKPRKAKINAKATPGGVGQLVMSFDHFQVDEKAVEVAEQQMYYPESPDGSYYAASSPPYDPRSASVAPSSPYPSSPASPTYESSPIDGPTESYYSNDMFYNPELVDAGSGAIDPQQTYQQGPVYDQSTPAYASIVNQEYAQERYYEQQQQQAFERHRVYENQAFAPSDVPPPPSFDDFFANETNTFEFEFDGVTEPFMNEFMNFDMPNPLEQQSWTPATGAALVY
ncbi:hypothetical protein CYLTODRAFT_404120 [Cylindrobasidium torrendii FP15055 ss-10]|uniref:HMG box domain-containing protein n=1 Tax=Cylindrobasidium torrendii FP15055 ss-10 TaxID=1314674 RepID=A0A0D7AXU9_9AGAR|nr:hypothetical protein CYLTODRAFT_404120 [Cylindrobasidium torrendii FP15055 ss-10]